MTERVIATSTIAMQSQMTTARGLKEKLMDNKQAIKKLRSQRDEICNGCLHAVGWCESHCGFSEAIDMAIDALKQPEIITCGECIHRFVEDENEPFNCCTLDHNDLQSDDWYCADAERRTE